VPNPKRTGGDDNINDQIQIKDTVTKVHVLVLYDLYTSYGLHTNRYLHAYKISKFTIIVSILLFTKIMYADTLLYVL